MNHIHFTDTSKAISVVSEMLAIACENPSIEQEKNLRVAGVQPLRSNVHVVDSVTVLATRELYFHALNKDESALDCSDCRKKFLELLDSSECEISLRVMDHLQKKGIPSSCENISFNSETKNVEVFLRKKASLVTQQVFALPRIYFGPFEKLCEVEQRQVAISSANSAKPMLGTWHLADCIAAAGFDKKNKVGFLFHIDEGSSVSRAIKKLTAAVKGYADVQYCFEYGLFGGADTYVQKARQIDRCFQSASDETICFKKRDIGVAINISSSDFHTDSYWSRSVRLCRSIVIDLGLEDPLSEYAGYEPEMNPFSVFHKRENSIEAADRFCLTTPSEMKCVLNE